MSVLTTLRGSRRIRAIGAALLLPLLAGVAACDVPPLVGASQAGAAVESGPSIIGFSPLNQTSDMLIHLGEGLKSYARSKGATVIVADPANSAANQVQQLTDWIDHGKVHAIWAIAVDANALRPVFAKARARGVVVLATGTPEDYGQSTFTAGTSYSFIDYTGYGRDVGRTLGECANARLGGRARVAYLHNPTGTIGAELFGAGLRQGLAAASPGSTVVATANNEVDQVASRQALLSAMRADSGVNAVAGGNDDAMLGSLRALTLSGKDPAKSCLVGAGGGKETLAAVKSGKLYAVAALGYEADLTQNVDQMLQMIDDPQVIGLQLLTPIDIIKK